MGGNVVMLIVLGKQLLARWERRSLCRLAWSSPRLAGYRLSCSCPDPAAEGRARWYYAVAERDALRWPRRRTPRLQLLNCQYEVDWRSAVLHYEFAVL